MGGYSGGVEGGWGMTVEKRNIFRFGYKGYEIVVWYCHHCCGQKPKSDKLWWWRVMRKNVRVFEGAEKSETEAGTRAMFYVDGIK